MKQLWTKEEDRKLKRLYGLLTYKEIALSIGRTWFAVRNRAHYIGLPNNRSNLGRKYSVNKDFFSVPNNLNSYWAGFIAADGCIQKNKLSIGLAIRDVAHLDRFCLDMDFNRGTRIRQSRANLDITCQEIVDDLRVNFNITERKSRTLHPPNLIDENHCKCFITGLIDGDGTIDARAPRIKIYGTKYLLQWVRIHFESWIVYTGRWKKSRVRKIQPHLHSYSVHGSRARQVADELLKVEVPRLGRKWSKILRENPECIVEVAA